MRIADASIANALRPLSAADLPQRLFEGSTTLPRLLRYRAETQGGTLALREKDRGVWRRYTWSHYYATVRRVALGLAALGLRAGDRIAIASENTPEWFYADLGAESLGAVTVGIYPTNPWPELQYIVGHSGARIVFTGDQEQTDKVIEALEREGGLPAVERIVCVDMKGMRGYRHEKLMSFADLLELGDAHLRERPSAGADLDAAIDAASPDDCCILVYTSGTTGPPKGSMISHRNIIYSAFTYAEGCGVLERHFEAVCYLPLCHMAERCYSMVMQLVTGGSINFAESIDTVAANVREIAPTFFIGVPRIYEKLHQGFLLKLDDSGPVQRWAFRQAMRLGRGLSERRHARVGRRASVIAHWPRPFTGRCSATSTAIWASTGHATGCAPARPSRPSSCGSSTSLGSRSARVTGLPSAGRGLPPARRSLPPRRRRHRVARRGVGPGRRRRDHPSQPGRFPGLFRRCERNLPELVRRRLAGVGRHRRGARQRRDHRRRPQEGDHHHQRRQEHLAFRDRERAEGQPIHRRSDRRRGGAQVRRCPDTDRLRHRRTMARDRGLAYTTYRSLTLLPEVGALVQQVVDAVNSRFARVESVRRFVLLEKQLDHDDGELTATQKVRRGVIDKKFQKELAEIYGE